MTKTKKITIIGITVTILVALLASVAVFAFAKDNKEYSKDKEHRNMMDEDHHIAQIDSISTNQITVTLAAIENSDFPDTIPDLDDSTDKDFDVDSLPQKGDREDFVFDGDKITLTVTSDIDLSGFAEGDIVVVEYNENNELESIKAFGDKRFNDSRELARVDTIDGLNITVSFGNFDRTQKPETTDDTTPDITESFVANGETKTLTATEASQLEGISVGDIIMIKYNEDNTIESINTLEDAPSMDRNKSFGRKNSKGSSEENSRSEDITDTTTASKTVNSNTTDKNSQNV